jgi:aconitate hydratase
MEGAGRFMAIGEVAGVTRLPYALRILLENLMRQAAAGRAVEQDISDLLARRVGSRLSFAPSRVFGQDILGKVMMVDFAALRDALAAHGMDPSTIDPAVPVDIVIDHSLQVDVYGRWDAPHLNLAHEYRRNGERFAFLRWCAESFRNVRVVPPGKGIMHQIHLEAIGQVVRSDVVDGRATLSPDTCIGTDSHTPMINGLGILGWGVGGIEAEAVMLGRPVSMALPRVIGVELSGLMPAGATPTDLVLAITEALRARDVVGEFVEFFGPALARLPVADRGTIANMAPEYGATAVYFPIDAQTSAYLEMTGRAPAHVRLVEAYARAQRLWREPDDPAPQFDAVVPIDLGRIRPSIAGPRNPEERIDLDRAASAFPAHCLSLAGRAPDASVDGVRDADVVIAAITSCTNTSNPGGMVAAGLLARNAVARGLRSKPHVKTSLAPGSHVVANVLAQAGLQGPLDALGFHVVGFGCTTCNGGSGPLDPPIAAAIEAGRLVTAAVLSGNRNFPGRVHPHVRAAYLASPALVVAYAIAGTMTRDLTRDPLGWSAAGEPVHLRDIWPSDTEIAAVVAEGYRPERFTEAYRALFDGGAAWDGLARAPSPLFAWDPGSTYVRRPPYFDGLSRRLPGSHAIRGARPLAILGDSTTTDDISPSGAISPGTPAAQFLDALGVAPADYNTYTTRRSNHDVAVRATFANIRLRNRMLPGVEGGFTRLHPDGDTMPIFDAALRHGERGVPLVVVAGRNYGCGSSRDWAAKGVALLGVKAIIAEGFERIHRTNLVGMGVLPLQFRNGTTAGSLGLDGSEVFDIEGLDGDFPVRGEACCRILRGDGRIDTIGLTIRLDTPEDIAYWRHGGILPFVWRDMMDRADKA